MWPSGPHGALKRDGLVVLAFLAAGCGQQAASLPEATLVDSAGVTIVTNPAGSIEAAPVWRLSSSPVVAIGSGASPDVPLYRVNAVTPLSGRRVAVATASPRQVRVFDATGAVLAAAGREGDGPGEFRAVASVVVLPGDSLVAWDDARRRISIFAPDGSFSRDLDVTDLAIPSPEFLGSLGPDSYAALTSLLPAGPEALVLFAVGMVGPGTGVRRVAAPTQRIDLEGELLTAFGPFPGEETFWGDQFGLAPYPFAASTYGATLGDLLIVGTSDASELRVFGPTGTLARIIRWPDRDRAVEGPRLGAWNAWLDEVLAPRSPDEETFYREFLDRMPLPEVFPAYAGIVVSDAGEIWVGDYPGQLGLLGLSSDRRRVPNRIWLVFDSLGEIAGTLSTPAGFQPHAVQEGLVWGVFTDELDVESVRAYEIQRP